MAANKSPAKFTDAFVKGLRPDPAKEKYYVRAELQGLALCVYRSGVKSWFFIFTFEGKRYSMALGNYPDVSLGKVKELYADAWKLYAAGKNPAWLSKIEESERRLAPTVKMLVDEYIRSLRKKSKDQDIRALYKHVVPALGDLKAAEIRRRDIINLLSSVMNEHGGGMSNQLRKYLSTMFNYAVDQEIIEVSPCSSVKKLAKSKPRERYLTEPEIIKVWAALSSDKVIMSDTMRRALKLILVTGQRPGDIAGMVESEIDGVTWSIPAERYKTDIDHKVLLTGLAKSLLTGKRRGGFVFPTSHHLSKRAPMLVNSMGHAVKRNLDKIGVAPFTPHDLRRTAATHLGRLGFRDEVIDAVLGHIKRGIIATYNQHDYEEEKKRALNAWASELQRMVSPKAVDKFAGLETPDYYEHDPLNPEDTGLI